MTVLQRIQELTKTDMEHKSLSALMVQTASELGELAQTLNYELEVFGSLHRKKPKEPAINEAVDLMICALAMAYALDGFKPDTLQRIEKIAHLKLDKWQEKQQENLDIIDPSNGVVAD
jgi:hypothetical protein